MTRALPLLLCALLSATAFAQDEAQPEIAVPDAVELVGEPLGAPLSGEALEKRTDQVASLLRCPVCQGSSVADSPAEMAQNMKRQTRDMLARGFVQEQILGYFELSYGEFVRMEPKKEGMNLLVWTMPAAFLLVGVFLLWGLLRGMRRQNAAPAQAAPLDRDALPDDPELARYVLEVRALAYGWPEGRAPKAEG